MAKTCSAVIAHLNRIQGQIEALKKTIENDPDCQKVAHLTNSILKSFLSVRGNIVEEFLVQELSGDKTLSPEKRERLKELIALYKG